MPVIEVSNQLYSQLRAADSTDDTGAERWQLLDDPRRESANR
ncbi:hypothetical protein [Halohasta salina]|nr:hypothetical protein [Halohasta salina]